MGTTSTPNLNLLKPVPFEEEDTWAPILNANYDKLDALGTVSAKAIAAVSPAADRLPYFTSGTAAAVTAFTAFARSLLDDADAATMRATLGLGGLSTLGAVDLTTNVTGVLPIANGGTGGSTAAAARTALSVPAIADLASYAPLVHTHTTAQVTGLDTALAGKAALVHTHAIADVTGLQGALDAKGPLNSPAFTGNPTAPTPSPGDNDTSIATTAFVQSAVAGVSTNSFILLANLTTTSGTSHSVGSLNLTSYKQFMIVVIGVSHGGTGGPSLQCNGQQITQNTVSSATVLNGTLLIEAFFGLPMVKTNDCSTAAAGAIAIQSSTGFTFTWGGGQPFDAGQILVYGVK